MNLFSKINNYKKNIAFIDEKNKFYLYKDLLKDVKKFDFYLKERSVVLILTSNTYESMVSYVASLNKHVVPILIDCKLNTEYVKLIINKFLPEFIFLPDDKKIDYHFYETIQNFGDYTLLKSKKKIIYNVFKELAILISTSGTTGSPKFVRLSYKNLSSNCLAINKYLKINEKHRTITTLPLSYSYGLSIINTHLTKGASIVLNDYSITQKNFWQLFNKNNITSFAGVPYHYEILKKIDLRKFDLSNLKYTTVAGGAMDKETLNYFIKLFKNLKKELIVMYGQTEASPRMSYLKWKDIENKKGSIGKPLNKGKFIIRKKNHKETNSSNLIGELVYKGDNVCLGYALNFNDFALGDENEGTLNTGDLAFKDNDNYFYIVGRIKRIIKLFGLRINLDDIESQLRNIGIECACVGKDDKLKIFIQDDRFKKNIYQLVSKKMKIPKQYFNIYTVKSFPKNRFGKINYKILEKK